MTTRPDRPRDGFFNGCDWCSNRWRDAYDEALFRADITGRVYRVIKRNGCWQIREMAAYHHPPPQRVQLW